MSDVEMDIVEGIDGIVIDSIDTEGDNENVFNDEDDYGNDENEDNDSECESSSIYNEITDLIDRAHELHAQIHNSFETLQIIHNLVESSNNIRVIYEGETRDLDNILEKLHEESLKQIEETGTTNFGQKLIDALDAMKI
jgi:hypothetical protein